MSALIRKATALALAISLAAPYDALAAAMAPVEIPGQVAAPSVGSAGAAGAGASIGSSVSGPSTMNLSLTPALPGLPNAAPGASGGAHVAPAGHTAPAPSGAAVAPLARTLSAPAEGKSAVMAVPRAETAAASPIPGKNAGKAPAASPTRVNEGRSASSIGNAASGVKNIRKRRAVRDILSGRNRSGGLRRLFHGGKSGSSVNFVETPGTPGTKRSALETRTSGGEEAAPAVEFLKTGRDKPAPTALETLARVTSGISGAIRKGARAVLANVPSYFGQADQVSQAERGELAKLTKSLKRLGYKTPKTIAVDETVDADRPTVAILAPASVYKLAIVREGGRQSPGDVHLALDPSWMIQETLPDGRTRLSLKKGLFFDADGQPWIAEYKTPRTVRYFANFYTMGANERDDGVPFETNLDVPMSSSDRLEHVTNDKLFTRILMAAKGIAVPATLALLLGAHPLAPDAAKHSRPDSGISVARMPEAGKSRRAEVRSMVREYLRRHKAELDGQVVVKPSGPNWHSSKGVEFFETSQLDEIVDHVVALSEDPDMSADGSVLLDSRLIPPPIYFKSTLLGDKKAEGHRSAGIRVDGDVGMDFLTSKEIGDGKVGRSKKDWNLRVFIARTPWGGTELGGIFARAGAWGIPTVAEPGGPNGKGDPEDAAVVVKYEDVITMLREQHGLLQTDAEVKEFTDRLAEIGDQVMASLSDNEAKRSRTEGEPLQAQTDFIGLDVMVQYRDGKLIPMIIEINDHDSGGQMHMERFYPERGGEHSRGWVATMLARARQDALKGKRIVIVGAGYKGKAFIFERAKELGMKVVLVDRPGSWASGQVEEFIEINPWDPDQSLADVMDQLKKRGLIGKLDGITSFWEDDIPLTSRIADEAGLSFFPFDATVAARDKAATRALMKRAGLPTPRYAQIRNIYELDAAMDYIGFPAILKPVLGAEAKMVEEVHTRGEALRKFHEIMEKVAQEAVHDTAFSPEAGLSFEQYLDGDEVDVDLVMRGGKPVFHSVTDNWPTHRPYFLATGSNLPSRLSEKAQEELRVLAYKSALALGLKDGVLHVEAKMTSKGPRIIEVNGRMGGVYVRDWVKDVWGVDLVDEAFYTAAGIPSNPYKAPEARTYLEGEFLIPDYSGVLRSVKGVNEAMADPDLHRFKQFIDSGSDVRVPPDGGDRVGLVTARGKDSKEAEKNLRRIRDKLRMEIR